MYKMAFCSKCMIFIASNSVVVVFLNKCRCKHGALHTVLHNDFPNIQAQMSPLTSAISGLLSFLTYEGGLGRYIANCIDTNKEVGREK